MHRMRVHRAPEWSTQDFRYNPLSQTSAVQSLQRILESCFRPDDATQEPALLSLFTCFNSNDSATIDIIAACQFLLHILRSIVYFLCTHSSAYVPFVTRKLLRNLYVEKDIHSMNHRFNDVIRSYDSSSRIVYKNHFHSSNPIDRLDDANGMKEIKKNVLVSEVIDWFELDSILIRLK